MIDQRLEAELRAVRKRQVTLRRARTLSFCWLSLAVVLISVTALCWRSAIAPGPWVLVVFALGLLAAVVVSVSTSRPPSNWSELAGEIERKFPDLDHRLLASVEQKTNWLGSGLGYIQDRLIRETVDHGRWGRWKETVSDGQLRRSRFAAWFSFAMVAIVAAILHQWMPQHLEAKILQASNVERHGTNVVYSVKVDPGTVEIERGTDLLVLARFEGTVPGKVVLVYYSETGEQHQVPLNRPLDDPVFGHRIPGIVQDLNYKLIFENQSSETFKVSVFDFPYLKQADVGIRYPKYTGMADKVIEDVRRVSAVVGSELSMNFRLNKPVKEAWLLNKDGRRIELSQNSGNPTHYLGQLNLARSEKYTLHLIDDKDRPNKYPPEFSFEALDNQIPKLIAKFPARDRQASPLEEFDLQAMVWDDYGVESYGVEFAIGDGDPQVITLAGHVEAKEKKEFQHMLLLEALKAKPDQMLSYHFWAEDFDASGKPRRTLSDIFFAEIRSFEEIYRQGQQPPGGQQQQQQNQQQQGQQNRSQQIAEIQKQIVIATWNQVRKPDRSKLTENIAVIEQSQRDAIEMLQQAKERLGQFGGDLIPQLEAAMNQAADLLEAAKDSGSLEDLRKAVRPERTALDLLYKLRSKEHEVIRQQQQQQRQSQQQSQNNRNQNDRQLQELELDSKENRYETRKQAIPEESAAQRENRQVLNRLKDLAQRQEDLNKRIQELENQLREAKSEDQKEEVRRQLKRLREEQQELLRDLDELRDRMAQPENQQRMDESRQQLEQTRENVRRTSEALEQNQLSQALNEGTRAERNLEELRDDFRKKASNQFAEDMKSLRETAREMVQKEEDIANKLDNTANEKSKSLRDRNRTDELVDDIQNQRENLDKILDDMKDISEQAEESEPLLAKELYDTIRNAHQDKVSESLELTQELVKRSFVDDAQQVEEKTRQGIQKLSEGIEQAAKNVLGDETQALERALSEVENLRNELQSEINQNNQQQSNQQQSNQQQSNQQQSNQQQSNQQQNNQQQNNQQQNNQQQNNQQQSNQQQSNQQQSNQQQSNRQSPQQRINLGQWETGGHSPIVGDDYRDWTDRLRDVEEMLQDPQLRSNAAEIRDRVRGFRRDLKRHSKDPNWSLVEKMVAEPLAELSQRIGEELAKKRPNREVVPIDRDPVPKEFGEIVQRYYERLGSGE